MKEGKTTEAGTLRRVLWEGEPYAMAFRLIPPGRFRMGARDGYTPEEPRHWVRIARPFWLGETPVTQAQYRFLAEGCFEELSQLEGNLGAEPSGNKNGTNTHPVEMVSCVDAEVVAKHLSSLLEPLVATWDCLPTRARLPTEAEWEYACRGGAETEYHTGDGQGAMEAAGWFENNSGEETRAVGLKAVNDFGLHDMHGNVWEWCRDVYDGASYREQGAEAVDPRGDVGDGQDGNQRCLRLLRGGSYFGSAQLCRASIRSRNHPGRRVGRDGFRLCLSSGPVSGGGAEVMGAEPASGAGESGAIDRATRAGGAVDADAGWGGAKLPPNE